MAEVQVDKVSMEVPARAAGTVHLLVAQEAVVPQGTEFARIDVTGQHRPAGRCRRGRASR
jgi:pyruvate/2-oxoglutarate dehydrogenase complex dihydrolipoamide acyltransferase (E2) component